MPLVSVTRLRVARARHALPFYFDTFRSLRQARRAPGYLTGSLLRDADRAFWTLTVWRSEGDMRAFRNSGAHQRAMTKLVEWCDEAVVSHWAQDGGALPSWQEAQDRLRREPKWTRLRHPSPRHVAGTFPDFKGFPSPPLGPKR